MVQITILGAGVVGLCTALTLREGGHDVTVLDRAAPGEGASHGNAGVVSPWSVVPQPMPGIWRGVPGWLMDRDGPMRIRARALPQLLPWGLRFLRNCTEARAREISRFMAGLANNNIAAYRHYLQGTGAEHLLVDSQYVNAFRAPERADLTDLAWRLRSEIGAPLELVDSDGLRAIEPALARDYDAGILIGGQARLRDPRALCRALADKAGAMGVRFRRGRVRIVKHDGDGLRLVLDGWEMRPGLLVLAAGIASADLLRNLGQALPLMAERGYHVSFPDPNLTLDNSVMDVRAKVVASQMADGLRVAGTAEFAEVDAPPEPRRTAALIRVAERMLPGLNTTGVSSWLGVRPSFPDSLPAIGRISGIPDIVAAFGHSHYGMIMAPGTARLVREIVSGTANGAMLAAVSPDRFD